MSMIKRRQLLGYGLVTTGGLLVRRRGGIAQATVGARRDAPASIPTLPASSIPRYTQPLFIPSVMPQSRKPAGTSGSIDYYEIAVRQFQQAILPPELGLPPTTVWGYGSMQHPETFSSPTFTLEARWQRPVRVKWINDLKDPLTGRFLPHLLPVDQTLHWANPPGGLKGRDKSCKAAGTCSSEPYTGPVPFVTHLHGVARAGQESDGFTEAWFLPAASNIPNGYAKTGTFYDYFKRTSQLGHLWEPGASVYHYPNNQRAGTLWIHDHTLGISRINVYAGPAGYYLIRGGPSDLPPGVLPGPAPSLDDCPGTRVYEIPLVIQDRTFKDDGSLYYPGSREHDSHHHPSLSILNDENDSLPPIWVPMFLGDTIVVNGRTWPYLEVEQRRYRFRILNACGSRFLTLKLSNGISFWQIGADAGGFLPAPVQRKTLPIGPAERVDIIVDFTNVPVGTEILLLNDLKEHEHSSGHRSSNADPTGEVMQLRVVQATSADTSTPPDRLKLPRFKPHGDADAIRRLSLTEEIVAGVGPRVLLQGTVDPQTSTAKPLHFDKPITEKPAIGATEIWELHNFTDMSHPIHVHDVEVEVVDRQPFGGSASPPDPGETGFKDTVVATPNGITRIKMKFETPGLFMWHCHIIEHEDNEMMRPTHVGPIPADLPKH